MPAHVNLGKAAFANLLVDGKLANISPPERREEPSCRLAMASCVALSMTGRERDRSQPVGLQDSWVYAGDRSCHVGLDGRSFRRAAIVKEVEGGNEPTTRRDRAIREVGEGRSV